MLVVALEVGPDGDADLFDVLVDAPEDNLLLRNRPFWAAFLR